MCTFCHNEKETYQHFFTECEHVKKIWNEIIVEYVSKETTLRPKLDFKSIIINNVVDKTEHFLNLICLVIKQHVYQAKCQKTKLNSRKIINEVKFIKKLELQNCISKPQYQEYDCKWEEHESVSLAKQM